MADFSRRHDEKAAQLDNILSSNPIGLNATDLSGVYTHWGNEKILGFTAEEVTGRLTPADLRLDSGFDLRAHFGRCREQGRVEEEFEVRHKNGDRVYLREGRVPLYDGRGRHIGYTDYLQDITESKRLLQQMLQAAKMASIGQMAAALAHEIRNPLASIYATVQFLSDEVDENSEFHEDLQNILNESKRVESLMQTLLDFSRPSQLQFFPVEINRLFKHVLSLVSKQARNANIELVLEAQESLPAVLADGNQ
ncbi:unnamed protein product, partial [marine sediment metagenome]